MALGHRWARCGRRPGHLHLLAAAAYRNSTLRNEKSLRAVRRRNAFSRANSRPAGSGFTAAHQVDHGHIIGAGPVMIPLFVLSIFFVMLVIVYLLTIRRGSVVSSGFMATADALLRKRDYLGLLAVSNRHGEAIARVVQKMLDFTTKNPSADFQQVREIAETEGTRVASSLNNRVIYLADIGMIAPMLGLLGTVFGIIKSFGALGADLGTARYALALQWRQPGAGQYGGRVGDRHSGHDFLRLFPRARAEDHFRTGICRDACPGLAFVAI